MTDEMIDTSDIPSLSDDFFEKADLRLPKQQQIYKKEKAAAFPIVERIIAHQLAGRGKI